MEPGTALAALDVSEDGGACLVAGEQASTMDELILQSGPEGLHCCVVIAFAASAPLETTGGAIT
jgi:hypothetical protein